ncbi:glycerophosphoinositol inositolphosphodiesterase GDPD2-like [Protopterus annectens]|uniref:glycerophosphoinositol inositolphosphodiesterase GDPD2-like n=1 Tax=Protopterus annectens TaxID=7888 RepID=UPI001CF98C5C|nr:glycerophosphoinositol inositolphosphodiesterase GDPD2-like [Protopterus annectens]
MITKSPCDLPGLSCIRCLYSCHCNQRDTTSKKCNNCWCSFVACVCLFSVLGLYFVWSIQNESHNFNEYAFRFIGVWFNWSVAVLVVFIILTSYSSVLLLLAFCHLAAHEQMNLHWIHKVLLFLTAVIVSLFIIYLDLKFSEQWNTIYISLKVTAPFIHIGVVLGFSFLAWLVTDTYYRTKKIVLKIIVVDAYLAVMVVLYLIPLVLTRHIVPPCLTNKIPPKPLIVGHRGAPMVAKETVGENLALPFVECAEVF